MFVFIHIRIFLPIHTTPIIGYIRRTTIVETVKH